MLRVREFVQNVVTLGQKASLEEEHAIMSKYRNIPVDDETYEMVEALCEAYEMGKRSKGAMIKKLAKAETEKLQNAKLLVREDDKSKTPKG